MAVVHGIGTFTITAGSTTTISPTVTWDDAGSHTPQALLLFHHGGATGTTTGSMNGSMGMTDGTTQYAMAWNHDDAVATSDTGSRVTNAGCLNECQRDGVETGRLAFSSFGTDTFSLTVPDAFTFTTTGYYIAFTGYTNAKVMIWQQPTATGSFSRTGAGFQADCGIFMQVANSANMPNNITANNGVSFGWATASAQAAVGQRCKNGSTSNYTWGQISTSYCVVQPNTSATTPANAFSLTSFDSDGITCNMAYANASANHFGVLLLEGGSPVATTTAAQTSTGTWNVTVTGVTPSLVLGMAHSGVTATQTNADEDGMQSIGALTSGAQFAIQWYEYNAETLGTSESYTRGATDKFLIHYDRTASDTLSATGEIAKSALADEQVTLNQSDADTAAVLIPLLVLGQAYTGGGGPSIPVLSHGHRKQQAA